MQKVKTFIKKNFENFAYFYSYLGLRIFISLGLSLLVGVLDGFGLAMFLPLLQMVDSAEGQAHGEQMGNLSFLVEGLEATGLRLTLTTVLIVILAFFILKGMVKFLEGYYKGIQQQFFIRRIRFSNIDLLSRLNYKDFITSDSGRIQNTFSGEVEKVLNGYRFYFLAVQQAVLVVVYISFAIASNLSFAILVLVGGGLTNFIFSRANRKTKELSKSLTEESHIFQGLLIQKVANFKYLKASSLIFAFGEKLKQSILRIEVKQRKIWFLGTALAAMREPLVMLVIVGSLLIQVNFLSQNLGLLILSLLFFHRSLTFLMALQNAWNSFLSVSGSLYNMTEFTKELAKHQESYGSTEIDNLKTGLQLKNLSFSFGEASILKDISLTINKNETIAFVGESGSGKTTLMNVLCGLLKVNGGMFYIDGTDSQSVNMRSFQKRVGYITQEPVIFNDTVYNNVTFWGEHTEQNLQRFERAIKMAYCYDFIMAMPNKERTLLGNSGVILSGGQRQRISIARELYKDVDFLFMDEATSALDSASENEIQENIEQLRGKYTIVIIAHRLATVKNADKIVLLNRGRIDRVGDFEELKRTSQTFKRMVELQEF